VPPRGGEGGLSGKYKTSAGELKTHKGSRSPILRSATLLGLDNYGVTELKAGEEGVERS